MYSAKAYCSTADFNRDPPSGNCATPGLSNITKKTYYIQSKFFFSRHGCFVYGKLHNYAAIAVTSERQERLGDLPHSAVVVLHRNP